TTRMAVAEPHERVRQRQDDVHIGHIEQLALTRGEPALTRLRLALGTMPVPTRVIGDGPMPAGATLIEMAAERSGPASRDRAQHDALLHTQPRMLLDESVTHLLLIGLTASGQPSDTTGSEGAGPTGMPSSRLFAVDRVGSPIVYAGAAIKCG